MSGLLPPQLADCAAPFRSTRRHAVIAGIVVALATVGLLALSGWFITAAAIAGSAGPLVARGFNYLVPSALIRLLAILRTVARYFERLLSHRSALSTLAAVRTRLFAKAAAAQAGGALNLSGGEAATLLGADVDLLEDRLIRGPALAGAFSAGLLAVALGALAGLGPALAIALGVALSTWSTRVLARRWLPERAEEATARLEELKVALVEYAASAGEIAVYGLVDRLSADLERVAACHDRAATRLARAEAAVAILAPAIMGAASAVAVATASAGPPLAAMAALAAAAAAEGLVGLSRSEIRAPSIDAALGRLRALASVDLAEPDAEALTASTLVIATANEAFTLPPGSHTAIVGRSGAGKTRLLETLAGLRADAPQQLKVDGSDVAMLGLYRLRPMFALVPQDPMLIAGTVLDNLRIARPGLTEPELWEALAAACLDEEVRRCPDGLDQWIGEGGLQISGGQRKRLALARALLAGKPWLLLDEPTEGLDVETERRVVAALRTWLDRTGAGLVLVSHRCEPLALCARVIGLE